MSENRIFRVFVSSTFSDLVEERNVLQSETFPRLERYCRERNASFQAIDLRWGVSGEASLDQQAMNICLGEIRRCQKITPRPNFLVLLGQRYGWMPPPPQVPVDVFARISGVVGEEQRALLATWYRLDENAVPPHYVLRPRDPGGLYVDYSQWQPVENTLQQVLSAGARAIGLTGDELLLFCASATHQEIAAGALSVEHPEDKVVCVYRELEVPLDAEGAAFFVDSDTTPIDALKEQLAGLVPEANIVRCRANWSLETRQPSRDHLVSLADAVYEALRHQIDRELETPTEATSREAYRIHPDEKLDAEGRAHHEVAERHLAHFVGRDDILNRIAEYIDGEGALDRSTRKGTGFLGWLKTTLPFRRSSSGEPRRLLLISGEGGMGKSALIAKAMEQAQRAHPGAHLVYRFIGSTPPSSSGIALLRSLCLELCRRYGGDEATVPQDANHLMHDFSERLKSVSAQAPLILVLDAVDQIPENDPCRRLAWLPFELPEYVHLLVTTRPLDILKALLLRQPQVIELGGVTQEEGESLLDLWLTDARRTVQPTQRAEVMIGFEESGSSPLYLRLAFEEVRRWASWDDPKPLALSVEGIIRHNLFTRLAHGEQHGLALVSRALGYLAASRYGLGEDEILGVLSYDLVVYSAFLRDTFHLPPDIVACAQRVLREKSRKEVDTQTAVAWLDDVRRDEWQLREFLANALACSNRPRLPVVVWARFLSDLEPYLTRRAGEGAPLLGFYHRELGDVSASEYLTPAKQELHGGLADCFRERGDPNGDKVWRGERRALQELPYHLPASERWDEAEALLTDLSFLEAKVFAGLSFELPEDFHWAVDALPADRPMRHILSLLDKAIRRDIHFIARHAGDYPQALFQCVWNHGWWYDCPAAVKHYDPPEGGWRKPPPWEQRGPKLFELLERWRAEREVAFPEAVWLRSHFPPPLSLASPLKVIMRGHEGSVRSVAFSPDGQRIVSCSDDKTVRIWNAESGAELSVLRGHKAGVNGVSYRPDGWRIVSGSSDATVRIWDAESGVELSVFRRPKGHVECVSYSPDGRRIVSGLSDATIRIWDAESGVELSVLREPVNCVSYSPDGRRIVSGSSDGKVRIWDSSSGAKLALLDLSDIYSFREASLIFVSVSYSPDGRRIVCGRMSRGVEGLSIWDSESQSEIAVHHRHVGSVNCVSYSPDGRRIVSGSSDATVRIWDAESLVELSVLRGHGGSVRCISYSPDGRQIVSCSDDKTIRIWDVEGGTELAVPRRVIAYSPDGGRIASYSIDKTVRAWDVQSEAELAALRIDESQISHAQFSPDGRRIIFKSERATRVWDTESGADLVAPQRYGDYLSFSPDGRRILSRCEIVDECPILLWDSESGARIAYMRGHKRRVNCVSYSPDGRRIVSGSGWPGLESYEDNTLRIWDAESGTMLAVLKGHEDWVLSVSYSPDGRRIVSGSDDKTVRIWDAVSGIELASLLGHEVGVESVLFDTDGRRIISRSRDKTVRVWDAQNGACLEIIQEREDMHVIAARERAFPLRVLHLDGETIIVDAWSRRPVAHFPDALREVTTHPCGSTWVDIGHILTLEGAQCCPNSIIPQSINPASTLDKTHRSWKFWDDESL